jgi:hypothetical protein
MVKVQDTIIAQKYLRLSKYTDMTIRWKGLEEHFLVVPFVFRFNNLGEGGESFSEFFFKKKSVLKDVNKFLQDLFLFL